MLALLQQVMGQQRRQRVRTKCIRMTALYVQVAYLISTELIVLRSRAGFHRLLISYVLK